MSRDFAIIAEFLDRNGPEVLGRAVAAPPDALIDRLTRFARGEVSQEERTALCEILQNHPEYLRTLASQVRRLHEGGDEAESQ